VTSTRGGVTWHCCCHGACGLAAAGRKGGGGCALVLSGLQLRNAHMAEFLGHWRWKGRVVAAVGVLRRFWGVQLLRGGGMGQQQ